MITLSIVTITYKDPDGLKRTLESLECLKSSDLAWEHLVIDSSPEENRPVLASGASSNLRHVVEPAGGIYPALNSGLKQAQGKYVWFLNGGDCLTNAQSLLAILGEIENENADLIVGSADLYRDGNYAYTQIPRYVWLNDIVGSNSICQQAVIYRRESAIAAGNFSTELRYAADYEHYWRMFIRKMKGMTVNASLVRYDLKGTSGQNYLASLAEFRKVQKSIGNQILASLRFDNFLFYWTEYSRLRTIKFFRASFLGPALAPVWSAWKRRMIQSQPGMTSLFGVQISRKGFSEAIALCEERIRSGAGGYVCFANVHSVTESLSNPALYSVFSKTDMAFADGVPLLWFARAKGVPIGSRVCGPDFMAEFIKRNLNERQGFVGGQPATVEALIGRFKLKSVYHSPPMRAFSEENVREDLQKLREACRGDSMPRIIWVGLGAPKQELWMETASRLEPGVLFFGVGAAFDFLSGAKSRAPIWMQKMGLEWLFRLFSEPGRLWQRYLKTNSLFVICAVLSVFSGERD